jgi:hypothetical protein
MKRIIILLPILSLLMFSSLKVNAQVNPDFFVGKWNVLTKGTPQGDINIVLALERKEGKLEGSLLNVLTKEKLAIDKVEEKENNITCYFSTQGLDLFIFLEKKDDTHLIGNMVSMYETLAERIIEDSTEQK